MSRKTAREEAFKLIYQIEFHKGDGNQILEDFFQENPVEEEDAIYIKDVVLGTLDNLDEIDRLIDEHAVGWTTKRISKVDLSILRLAIYEILKREDIPISVSINEAVELAKIYDNQAAAAFINGILGSIQKKIENPKE